MTDIIILGIVAVILIFSIGYIVKSKKAGAKCIGCPLAGSCSGKMNSKEFETANCCCCCGDNET